MTGMLRRKVRRDLWRYRWQFLAAIVVLGIGVAVFVGATNAYADLKQSLDCTYAEQLLPDIVISGPGVAGIQRAAQELPGTPVVQLRQQADVFIRVNGRTLFGRAVGVPVATQPEVSKLALQSGDLPALGSVVTEHHLTSHYALHPGSTIELLGPSGWRAVGVSGSALSTEYLWPARSRAETFTTPDYFGVVFVPAPDMAQFATEPTDQLLAYAQDRQQARDLVAAATELRHSHQLVVVPRDELPSYTVLLKSVESLRTFATLLPWVFLVAAVVGTYVLLSRLVTTQRAVIGTLSANGLSGRTIRTHYLTYGFAAAVAGSTWGIVGGQFLGGWFTTQYVRALGLPLRVVAVHPTSLIIGAAAGTAAAALAAWAPARTASRISPAEAMRILPSGTRGGASLPERLLPLRWMPTRWRMTLRGITRNRRRTILTIAGVVSSVCLVMVCSGMRDTVNSVIERQYGQIELQDAQVLTSQGAAESVADTLRADSRFAAAETFTRLDVTAQGGNNRYDTILVALWPTTQMHNFASSGSGGLPRDGVLLGEGLRTVLGVDVGDRVSITNAQYGIRLEQPIVGFVDEPTSPVVYISAEHLSALTPSGVMVQLAPGSDAEAARQAVITVPGVVGYLSTESIMATAREAYRLYNVMVALIMTAASLMAAALLYTAMSANVSERTGELGALQAAGIDARLLGRLVSTENMMLAVIALPGGLIAGALLAEWFLSTYITEGYRWHLVMHPTTPVLVAVAILLGALLAQIPTFRVIRRIDLPKTLRERSQ